MRFFDLASYNFKAILRHRFRTFMMLIAMSIGVIAVNLLTGLGEGARLYVLGEFSFLGKNTLIMLPGKKETTGGMPPITGESPRDITLADVEALSHVPGVARIAPLIAGSAEVSFGSRHREAVTMGTNANFFTIRKLSVKQGKALPDIPNHQAEAVCVLGNKIRQELFGSQQALGQWVRAGNRRFRVIGILEERGQTVGMDMSDIMLIPIASAQMLFNQEGLFRVFVDIKALSALEPTKNRLIRTMKERHEGEEDITIITQDAVLSSFNDIIQTMTFAVGGIGAISLLVAGILIMNVMLITVSQRTSEIGLLKALGASSGTIRLIFLSEAALIALAGGLLGLVISESLIWLASSVYPSIPFTTPWWAKVSSLSVAAGTAAIFSWLPAQRAANLAPVDALTTKRGS
jgi:putative ABC transport system permease protein